MALAVVFRFYLDHWRQKAMTTAGMLSGFHRLRKGETLPVVTVPLLESPAKKFLLIMRGALNGYEAAFLDLYCSAGSQWFYQSLVILNNPQVRMPKFQLKPPDWTVGLSQRTCGKELKIPGREEEMRSLRLSGDDPLWTTNTFSNADSLLFKKLRNFKWTIEGSQHSLVIYRWGQKVSARKLQDHLNQVAEIAEHMYSLCR